MPSASEILDFAEWTELIRQTLKEHLDVDVPTDVAIKVLSTVAPQSLDTTPANAMHIMRSSLCCQLLGGVRYGTASEQKEPCKSGRGTCATSLR